MLALIPIAVLVATLIISIKYRDDTDCRYNDCSQCPYDGQCPWERKV